MDVDQVETEEEQKSKLNAILCMTWVPRGVAAANPDKIELTAEELQNLITETHSELEKIKANDDGDDEDDEDEDDDTKMDTDVDAKDSDDKASDNAAAKSNNDSTKEGDEFDFEKYDEEADEIYTKLDDIAVISKGKDPLITVADSEDEDSEAEDEIIKPDDNLLLVGHVQDEASILEVHVFNESEGSFYCHHHDFLPDIPLCLEWFNYDPSEEKPANLCAIGYHYTPIIEAWDLDVIGGTGPVFKLKKKGHKDSVLDLAWNTHHRHVLASASADKTVLLWDLDQGIPANKLKSFKDKVQAIKWHKTETFMLLTGCMDKKVRLFDCNSLEEKVWTVSGEVEKVVWSNADPNICFVSTDNGFIECIDVRQEEVSLWKRNIQEGEVAGLSMSSSCPGLLVSSSQDGTITVWDVKNHMEPQSIFEKQTNTGRVICLESNCDSPLVFAVGGDNRESNLNTYNLSTVEQVAERFKDRIQQ
ncbi:hypothetical protein TKK_0009055 [Trichogramma kaykai]|uniref:Uncharacterized protein n=1 Tax=Trichogramma kaykai TaxID=54128 RepID=A0ABD2X4H4_9HYME